MAPTMNVSDRDLQKFLRTGLRSAGKAADLILAESARGFATNTKADGSFVTTVDTAVERLLRHEIQDEFPEHAVLGEEFGTDDTDSDFQWVIDPIDGTLAFKMGLPFYGTLLCLTYRDRPIVSVVAHPSMGLTYHAVIGGGAFRNGHAITTGNVGTRAIPSEMIGTGDAYAFRLAKSHRVWTTLQKQHPLVRTIPDCVGHTQAAQGSIGAMIDYHLNLWDFAATRLLVEEAGGKFVITGTNTEKSGHKTHNIICGKPRVVDWIRKTII